MRGFTLAEIVIVIALLGIAMTILISPYAMVNRTRDAQIAARTYGYALREAADNARTMEFDTAWGVKLATSTVTVFSGTSYAARTTSRDKSYTIARALTFAGPTEIVFTKFSGTPNTTGTTTIAGGYSTSTVTINATGAVGFIP